MHPSVPVRDELIGRVIGGRFEVTRLLINDSLGQLLAAHDRKADRLLSLRVVRSATIASRLGPELSAVAKLTHPNLLAAIGVLRSGRSPTSAQPDADEGSTLIVQGVLDGRSVTSQVEARRLDATRFAVGQACHIVSEVAGALTAVHVSGPHGAVGPETVWTDARGGVLLTDLVLSRAVLGSNDGREAQDARRALFLAPEVKRGGLPQTASDVYGLSGLLYLLLTGRLPAERWVAPSELRSEVTRGLDIELRRGLSLDPTARHASPEVFQAAVLEALRTGKREATRSKRLQTPRAELPELLSPVPAEPPADLLGARATTFPPPPPQLFQVREPSASISTAQPQLPVRADSVVPPVEKPTTVKESVPAAARESVPAAARESVPAAARESVPAAASEAVAAAVRESVRAAARESVRAAVMESIRAAVRESAAPVARESAPAVVRESVPAAIPVAVKEEVPQPVKVEAPPTVQVRVPRPVMVDVPLALEVSPPAFDVSLLAFGEITSDVMTSDDVVDVGSRDEGAAETSPPDPAPLRGEGRGSDLIPGQGVEKGKVSFGGSSLDGTSSENALGSELSSPIAGCLQWGSLAVLTFRAGRAAAEQRSDLIRPSGTIQGSGQHASLGAAAWLRRQGKPVMIRGGLGFLLLASLTVLIRVQGSSEQARLMMRAHAELSAIRKNFRRQEAEQSLLTQAVTLGQASFVVETKVRGKRGLTTQSSQTVKVRPLAAVHLDNLAQIEALAQPGSTVTVHTLDAKALAASLSWRLTRAGHDGAPTLKGAELFWAQVSQADVDLEQQVADLLNKSSAARKALGDSRRSVNRFASATRRRNQGKMARGPRPAARQAGLVLSARTEASTDAQARYEAAAERAERLREIAPAKGGSQVAAARVTVNYGSQELTFDVPVPVTARSVPVAPLAGVDLAATRVTGSWDSLKDQTPEAAFAIVASRIPWHARPMTILGIEFRGIRLLQLLPCVFLALLGLVTVRTTRE